MFVHTSAGARAGRSVRLSLDLTAKAHDTTARIARLHAGPLQRLGDDVLPHILPATAGLVPHGINDDDETVRGVPDSYVGAKPETCTIAIEYTRQKEHVTAKLTSDYKAIRKNCPHAQIVCLVSAQRVKRSERVDVEKMALTDSVELHIIDGPRIAEVLDRERQDLRYRHLNIPIGYHSRESLLQEMSIRCGEMLRHQMDSSILPMSGEAHGRLVKSHRETKGSWTLISGPLGIGKSTWMNAYAEMMRQHTPTFMSRAVDLMRPSSINLLSELLTQAAYGVPGSHYTMDLAELLKRERLMLIVIIDGIDEVASYEDLKRHLQDFRISKLSEVAHVVLTCREEAEGHWKPLLVLPARSSPRVCRSWIHAQGGLRSWE